MSSGERPTLAIRLEQVSVLRGQVWSLRDISTEFKAGCRYALVGANGAGKTQLLKLLAGDVWPTPTGREALEYRVGRRKLAPIDAKSRLAYLGAELQDKYARHGWNPSVFELLATGLHHSDILLSPPTARERAQIRKELRAAGLGALAQRRFATLSYGQKRLGLLARALVARPDWLLLDEPYNGLDKIYRRRIDTLLQRARCRGQAWVIAAHRASDLPLGTQEILNLAQGRLTGTAKFRREHRELLAAEAAETHLPRRRPARARRRRGEALVAMSAIDLYVDYRRVLRDLHWTIRQGEQWAITGSNGSGKTSLLKMIYGDLAPALGGTLRRAGLTQGTPIAEWKRQVGYVAPELQTDYAADQPQATVLELVASGRHASMGMNEPLTARDCSEARRALRSFCLTTAAKRLARELSYGQMRRALFARALIDVPRLLLLDEPLTGLDPRERGRIKSLLCQWASSGVTCVMAVHHAEDLPPFVTDFIDLAGGRCKIRRSTG